MKKMSAKHISNDLIEEIFEALRNIRGWGSVEIIVQNSKVVQITERNIKKIMQLSTNEPIAKIGS